MKPSKIILFCLLNNFSPYTLFSGLAPETIVVIDDKITILNDLMANKLDNQIKFEEYSTIHAENACKIIIENTECICSPNQLFFDATAGTWKKASDFMPNDVLLCANAHTAHIDSITIIKGRTELIQITLDKPHIFFCTEKLILAHNHPFSVIAEIFGEGMTEIGIFIGSAAITSSIEIFKITSNFLDKIFVEEGLEKTKNDNLPAKDSFETGKNSKKLSKPIFPPNTFENLIYYTWYDYIAYEEPITAASAIKTSEDFFGDKAYVDIVYYLSEKTRNRRKLSYFPKIEINYSFKMLYVSQLLLPFEYYKRLVLLKNIEKATAKTGSQDPIDPDCEYKNGDDGSYHHKNSTKKSQPPRDGASALKRSIFIKQSGPNRQVRLAIEDGKFVLFKQTSAEPKCVFHGYIVEWDNLDSEMKIAAQKAGLANSRGKPLG